MIICCSGRHVIISVKDFRIKKLAWLLVNHSCAIKQGEKVLIESIGAPNEIVLELIRGVKAAGGIPFINLKDDQINRGLCLLYEESDIKLTSKFELYKLRQMDAFIGIRAFRNINEFAGIPQGNLKIIMKHYIQPVHLEERNNNTKWVYNHWPTPSMTQRAGMSTEDFENYYFDACSLNYAKMLDAMEPLVNLIQKTEKVQIVGPGDTDISFLIKGMPQCRYAGKHNIPDGEFFTAPIRESVNGKIQYNVPSIIYGAVLERIYFEFKDGKIIKATCKEDK